jgi:hypothetical protein
MYFLFVDMYFRIFLLNMKLIRKHFRTMYKLFCLILLKLTFYKSHMSCYICMMLALNVFIYCVCVFNNRKKKKRNVCLFIQLKLYSILFR